MSSTPYVVVDSSPALSGIISRITATVSTNTPINLANIYTSIATVVGIRSDTLASITASISGTVITITTGGMTNVYVTLLVAGTR